MRNIINQDSKRYRYPYLTDKVAARARTDELLQELVQALVYTVADYDTYATGKSVPFGEDHEDSYWYFRGIFNRLGIPSQAILDVIDECCPDDQRGNLTECSATSVNAG